MRLFHCVCSIRAFNPLERHEIEHTTGPADLSHSVRFSMKVKNNNKNICYFISESLIRFGSHSNARNRTSSGKRKRDAFKRTRNSSESRFRHATPRRKIPRKGRELCVCALSFPAASVDDDSRNRKARVAAWSTRIYSPAVLHLTAR